MIDPGLLGTTAAGLMDMLEERYEGDDTAELVEVMVVAVVKSRLSPEGDEDNGDDGYSNIHYHCSATEWYIQLGIAEALRSMAFKV